LDWILVEGSTVFFFPGLHLILAFMELAHPGKRTGTSLKAQAR
jgi:hypothetical protein